MRIAAVLTLLLCLASPSAFAEILLSVAPGGGQRPPDPILRKIDSANGSTVPGSSATMTLAAYTVVGATGLARHPQTGVLYALLKVQGSSFRRLVTLDETTGVATDIGDTAQRFAGMAFSSNGTLYAITGDGSGVAEKLYTVSTSNASSVHVMDLGSGSDGETIAFNPSDGLLYHASGIGTPNHPNGERFEKIDLTTLSITNIPLSGFDYEELTSLTYLDGGFVGGDLGNATADNPRFFRIAATGAVTFLGNMDHVSKGLAPVAPPVPAAPTTGIVALALALALTGSVARRRNERLRGSWIFLRPSNSNRAGA